MHIFQESALVKWTVLCTSVRMHSWPQDHVEQIHLPPSAAAASDPLTPSRRTKMDGSEAGNLGSAPSGAGTMPPLGQKHAGGQGQRGQTTEQPDERMPGPQLPCGKKSNPSLSKPVLLWVLVTEQLPA